MLQVYSLNVPVAGGASIPLNNRFVWKGKTSTLSATSTIQLNKCGVYMVFCNGSVTPAAAGEVGIQMYKNGVAQPQAQSTVTGAADTTAALSFMTFVQVTENNTCCCCTSPTVLQFNSTGAADTTSDFDINICVTKIC
jgi:hypothetical protein